jgi:hypothetical protein
MDVVWAIAAGGKKPSSDSIVARQARADSQGFWQVDLCEVSVEMCMALWGQQVAGGAAKMASQLVLGRYCRRPWLRAPDWSLRRVCPGLSVIV